MTRNITNYGKSVRMKLLTLAHQENIYYQTLLTRYFQERLLYRISQTSYRNHFYLKGGALMFAYEGFSARPTLDIDFLGENISNDGEKIAQAFREICAVPFEDDGVTYEVDKLNYHIITEFKDYHGIRLSVPVSMDTISQVLTMDIGFGDVVTPSPVSLDYPLLLDNMPGVHILAYSIETVIAEKMHAVIDLGDRTSRMKDYYDLYHILTVHKYDAEVLKEAVIRTFKNRRTSYKEDTMFFRPNYADHPQLSVKWNAFIRKITSQSTLTFSEVVRYLQSTLKPYWENLKGF
jgi:predicted nucleotidyltransferase component of viral defense system